MQLFPSRLSDKQWLQHTARKKKKKEDNFITNTLKFQGVHGPISPLHLKSYYHLGSNPGTWQCRMGEGQSRNYCWCESGKKILKEERKPHTQHQIYFILLTLSSGLHHFLIVKKRLGRNSIIQKLLGYTNLQCKLCFQQINSQLPVHLWILHLKEEDKNDHICYRYQQNGQKNTDFQEKITGSNLSFLNTKKHS